MNKRINKKMVRRRIHKDLLGFQTPKESTMVRISASKSIFHLHKANCNYARVRGGFYNMKKQFEHEQELEALYEDWNLTIY